MKPTYKPILTSALALATAIPVMAQTEDEATQQELVNAAFRKVAAEDLMGGSASVNVEELMKKNNFTGALENMQGYVGGWNGAGLWGNGTINGSMQDRDILVLIDGAPRDFQNVKPDEIEDITFLKGAQAVILYGSRAAKGVILISTKRGKEGDLRINVKANTGWNVAKSYPEYLHSAEYMDLYNEARQNDGLSPRYDQSEIYHSAIHDNPYRYPDVNFYSSDYIRKAYNRSDVSAEITGGNRLARFYSNISYYRDGDYLNFGEAKNNMTDRFDVRGNVDLRLSDYVSGFVNAAATYYDSKSPVLSDGVQNFWQEATTFRPNRLSPLVPKSFIDPTAIPAVNLINASANIIDGIYFLGAGSVDQDFTNVFADYYAAGKQKFTSRQFQFDAGINIDLQKVLKGLSFHTQVSVDYATSYTTSYRNEYRTFTPTWSTANGNLAIIGATDRNNDKHSGVQNVGGSTSNQTVAFNAHFDYNRTFAQDHNVSAMLLANGFSQMYSGKYHRTTNANLGFDLGYNFKHKYYAEAALALVHSSKLPDNGRQDLSQSYTLGWNLANEAFMQDKGFDYLKLSASWSSLKTDLGIDEFYMYLGNYTSTGWWDWGGSGVSATASTNGGNMSLGYIERNELNVSLQGSILDRTLWWDATFFMTDFDGQLISSDNNAPSYFKSYYPEGQFYSYINYNNDRRTGVDFSINYKKEVGDWMFQAGLNGTYYTTKATRRDDTQYADDYQKRQGRYLDGMWGYECLGFYTDLDDVANSPESKIGAVRPGDLKYKDQNGDGVIDAKDQIEIGKWSQWGNPFTLGLNLTAQYKGWTLFAMATAGFGGTGLKNNSYWQSGASERKYTAVVRDRAIVDPTTHAVTNLGQAKYPALTINDGASNFQTSDFWTYNNDRINLAKVQLTYDFSEDLFKNNKVVRGLSIYASGSNLLTIAPEREILEMNVGSAPQSRFYNLGVKVQF